MSVITDRLTWVRANLRSHGVDSLLVTKLSNIRYLSGFTGTNGYLLIGQRRSWFLTDSRYKLQARAEVKSGKSGFRVCILKSKPFDEILKILTAEGLKKLGFDGAVLTYDGYLGLKKTLKGIKLKSVSGVVEGRREVKDLTEIEKLRRAVETAMLGFRAIERRSLSGKSENEVAGFLEGKFRESGGEGLSFETIVASGERGALPHGAPSAKIIKKGELVVIDAGLTLDGYKSDCTRTYITGRATKEQRKIYSVVKDAHDRAIEKVKVGVRAKDIDKVARSLINKAGYGKYFGHGTGHGVGLDIHERPTIGPTSDTILEEGMVFTVEPGIYLPGHGGVRIEDMVVVKSSGSEVLGHQARDLISLK